MARTDILLPSQTSAELPKVRRIGVSDLGIALEKGLDDFKAMPTYVVFLCLIYPVVGLALAGLTFGLNVVPIFYPMAAGFALVGPFAAIGLYELSRRREMGLDTSWRHVFDIRHSPSFWPILELGGLLLVIFAVWLATAEAIYESNFGLEPLTLSEFVDKVANTPEGQHMVVVGNAVGFLFAVLAFALSSISFPLLLDRNVGMAVAIITSIRAILVNPVTFALWGFLVAGLLAIGAVPFLLGLTLVVPVLGHASWHLYRRVVEPAQQPPKVSTVG